MSNAPVTAGSAMLRALDACKDNAVLPLTAFGFQASRTAPNSRPRCRSLMRVEAFRRKVARLIVRPASVATLNCSNEREHTRLLPAAPKSRTYEQPASRLPCVNTWLASAALLVLTMTLLSATGAKVRVCGAAAGSVMVADALADCSVDPIAVRTARTRNVCVLPGARPLMSTLLSLALFRPICTSAPLTT